MNSNLGIVHLVGAGPGDPGLITVDGLRVLRRAHVVIFDRLIDRALLAEAPPDAERIDVGKRPGDTPVTQNEINELILDRARKGRRVVRLKGGDPFIFGRGFEELSVCRKAAVDCIVIPGVTSAIAAPEVAGVPLTLRGVSRSFAVLTAETAPDTDNAIDFSQVRGVDTLVILMGRAKLESIVGTLMKSGWSPGMPVVCIEKATTSRQRSVIGTLSTIAEIAQQMELSAPMVTVIGEVARHGTPSPSKGEGRGEGKDFETSMRLQTSNNLELLLGQQTSLVAKRILITRPRPAAQKLAAKLEQLGGEPIVCPLLRVVITRENTALDAAISNLPEFSWLAFTSAHAVRAFWRRLDACGFDARRLFGCKLAALGFATARKLRCYGLSADVSARNAGELAAAITSNSEGSSGRVLWPRGNRAMAVFRNRLCDAGYAVDDLEAYRTLPLKPAPAVLDDIRCGVDAVLIYSPSAAKQLASLDLSLGNAMILCVGQTTAAAAKAVGLHVDAIAAQPSDDGVLAELERCFSNRVTV